MTSAVRTFVTGEIAHFLSYSSSFFFGRVPEVRVVPCFHGTHMWTVLGTLGDTVMPHFAVTNNLTL